jgi:hypothetical protein
MINQPPPKGKGKASRLIFFLANGQKLAKFCKFDPDGQGRAFKL